MASPSLSLVNMQINQCPHLHLFFFSINLHSQSSQGKKIEKISAVTRTDMWIEESLPFPLTSNTVLSQYTSITLQQLQFQLPLLFSHNHDQLCDPWTAAHQASLSFSISWSLVKLMSMESVTPCNHLILSSPSPPAFNLSQQQSLF